MGGFLYLLYLLLGLILFLFFTFQFVTVSFILCNREEFRQSVFFWWSFHLVGWDFDLVWIAPFF